MLGYRVVELAYRTSAPMSRTLIGNGRQQADSDCVRGTRAQAPD